MHITSILSHPAWNGGSALLMVVATALLVRATYQLAKTAQLQLKFSQQQASHSLKMAYIDRLDENGMLRWAGFTLTNTGVPAVTVMNARISLGIPVADSKTSAIHSALPWTSDSTFKPPHRLLSGERITVMYDLKLLKERLDPGQRVRHESWDSLGNRYVSGWLDYYAGPNSLAHHDSPGEGFREPTLDR